MLSSNETIDYSVEAHPDLRGTFVAHQGYIAGNLHGSTPSNLPDDTVYIFQRGISLIPLVLHGCIWLPGSCCVALVLLCLSDTCFFPRPELRQHLALYTLHKSPKDRKFRSGPPNMIT